MIHRFHTRDLKSGDEMLVVVLEMAHGQIVQLELSIPSLEKLHASLREKLVKRSLELAEREGIDVGT